MANIRKTKAGTYEVAIRPAGRKPIYKTFPKKAQAEAWAKETEAAQQAGSFQDFRRAEKTLLVDKLRDYELEITPSKKSQRTERMALANLRAFFSHDTLASCQPRRVVAYSEMRLKDVVSDTLRRELQILSDVFETCRVGWGITCLNPVPEARKTLVKRKLLVPGVKRERRLYEGELACLLGVPCRKDTDLNAVIEFDLETAMRRSELLAMRRAHRDKPARTLRIPDSKTDHQTGRQGRTIPLSPRAMQILDGLVARLDGLFWNYSDPDALSRAFARRVIAARKLYEADCRVRGIDADPRMLQDLRFHDLRHEATTRLFEKGWSVAEVAAVTGHEDWDSLKRYTHIRPGQLVDKMEGFGAA